MKKFLMMMIALVFAGAANAQMATQNAKILDNTYITVGGGVATPLDFYDVLPLNPTATIAVGKWFNPRVGAEIEGTAWFGSHDVKGTLNRWDHVNTHNIVRGSYVGLNGLINWSNVFAHYRGTPRLFEVNSIVGIGWAHINRPGLNDKYSNCLGAKTGLDLAFNLGKKKANTLSVRPAVLWDLSHPGDGAGKLAFNKLGAQLQLGVAYTYHFKTSNGTYHFKTYDIGAMEYEIARAVGYSNPQIIYNGPFKGPKLEEHLLGDGILNIDNLEEIDRVVAFANKQKRMFRVGIRVNINVGQSFISRFGIDADSDDLQIAVEKLRKCKYTKLVGLHCHIGQSRGIDAWKKRTEIMLALADQYIEGVPEYLDLGSGMFGDMVPEMLKQFVVEVPTYEEYAQVTSAIVNEHYLDVPEENKPTLFTEPGTTVDNRYIDLIAEVDSIKEIKGKAIGILNCSIQNLGDVCLSAKLPLEIISNSEDRKEYRDMDLVGYTCLERDVPFKNFSGVIGKGDYVVFTKIF